MWKITYRKRASMGSSQLSNKKQIRSLMVEIFLIFLLVGCDASILLDGLTSEKKAVPNSSVRGYELIDAIKEALEAECQGLVSCADIISMATRDAVVLAGGKWYDVETGRRDGDVSLTSNVNLPAATISVSDSIKLFASKNLTQYDMVYLLG
ncbi:peroxidase 57-like [Solanum stenotomum]|uniref:peroxidase 57-like n=1 Tax=Solanum stenotomum TaxID=172797 RepID=UPI0020D0E15D|nr:peroxidase 57-like [Solanum stenotomum]